MDQIHLQWWNVSCKAIDSYALAEVEVDNSWGQAQPGRLTAIVGSGSNQLLEILAGRRKLNRSAQILINGSTLHMRNWAKAVG